MVIGRPNSLHSKNETCHIYHIAMLQTFSVRASPLVGSASSVNSQARRARVAVRASQAVSEEGFEMMRKGVKVAAEETVLTPRYVSRGRPTRTGPGKFGPQKSQALVHLTISPSEVFGSRLRRYGTVCLRAW